MVEKVDAIITVFGLIGASALLAIYIVGFFPLLAILGIIAGISGAFWMLVRERF